MISIRRACLTALFAACWSSPAGAQALPDQTGDASGSELAPAAAPAAPATATPAPAAADPAATAPAKSPPVATPGAPQPPQARSAPSRSSLIISETLHGRLTIRDTAGRVVSELAKPDGVPIELGLEPGSYRLSLESDGAVMGGAVEVGTGERVVVAHGSFAPAGQPAQAAAVAPVPVPMVVASPVPTPPVPVVHVPLRLTIGLESSHGPGQPIMVNSFVLGLLVGDADRLRGLSVALVGNRATDIRGAQFGVGFNFAEGDGRGIQAATGLNLLYGSMHGAQLTSGINIVGGGLHGLQAAAGANIVRGDLHGAQLSSGVNIAGMVDGLQIALVNIGGDVHGGQIGLINVARSVRGLQLGLVNLSRDAAAPVGLISYASEGQHHLALWANEVGAPHLGLKLGGRVVYGVLFGGIYRPGTDRLLDGRSGASDRTRYATGLGLGFHSQLGPSSFVDFELLGTGIHDPYRSCGCSGDHSSSVMGTARLLVGLQLARHLAIFGGPSYNVLTSWNGRDLDYSSGVLEHVVTSGATTVRMYPGLVLGAQI